MEQKLDLDLERYLTKDEFKKIKDLSEKRPTPFLVIDLTRIAIAYDNLKEALPYASIYFAIKASPSNEVLRVLRDKGASFDFASRYELDQMMALGVPAARLSYGNPIKKREDIAYAYSKGIRLYATDSDSDIEKLSEVAPGSRVFFRVFCDCEGADWPLSRKFGTSPDEVIRLAKKAKKKGLEPWGLSFHVGSQQRDTSQWDVLISACAEIFKALKEDGIELVGLNLGGGLPADYAQPTEPLAAYARAIKESLDRNFPDKLPFIMAEPGRSLAANCGVIVSEIVLISKKEKPWVFLDVGKFGGLAETIDESIRYPIYVERKGNPLDVTLAGPTCDSMDVMYDSFELPSGIREGDKVFILTAGAYTSSYSAIGFNGIPPLKTYFI